MSRILHIGLGSFHRAHQAFYLNQLHRAGDKTWFLAGGNIRDDMAETVAALQVQGGEYTLETISPKGEHAYERITSIKQVISYTPDIVELIACGADPATKIITFTVTEAGYYLDAKNRLDLSNFPDLRADLAAATAQNQIQMQTRMESSSKEQASGGGSSSSSSAASSSSSSSSWTIYGALMAILRQRMKASSGSNKNSDNNENNNSDTCDVTLLCCDNLRHNGDRSRSGLLQFIELAGDAELLAWVQAHTTSPNAMVDRITPRPTPAVRERVKAATGVNDPAVVMGESFIQWVIEDNFIAGRPAYEKVGVEMVQSVQAYEEAKIRLLNATHSCIAWAGTLVGYLYIHEGTLDPAIRKMAFDYVTDDVIPVLSPSPLDLARYRDVVLDRFGNTAIADTNQRVAMDGFSKIPGFIVPTIRERLARDEPIASVAMLLALFLAYLHVWHRGGLPYKYQDQAMDVAVAHAICDSVDPVAALCAEAPLWGTLAGDSRLIAAVRQAFDRVARFVAEH